jgi:hypothetical protein
MQENTSFSAFVAGRGEAAAMIRTHPRQNTSINAFRLVFWRKQAQYLSIPIWESR